MNNNVLSASRLWDLMRHDVMKDRKSTLSAAGAISGVVVVLMLIASAAEGGGVGPAFHRSIFTNILFVGGYITTSLAFDDLHKGPEGIRYLLIPASTLEKLLSRLLLTSVGYTLFVGVIYTLASALGAALGQLIFSVSPGVFLHTDSEVWQSVLTYLVTQSAFLFGSIYFRKAAFLKTILAMGAVAFGLGAVYLLAGRILFAPAFTGFLNITGSLEEYFPDPGQIGQLAQQIERAGDLLTYVVAPVFFWVVGYLRLRETEA